MPTKFQLAKHGQLKCCKLQVRNRRPARTSSSYKSTVLVQTGKHVDDVRRQPIDIDIALHIYNDSITIEEILY